MTESTDLRPAGILSATCLPQEVRFLLTPCFEAYGGLGGAIAAASALNRMEQFMKNVLSG